jgi:hypothetical protein
MIIKKLILFISLIFSIYINNIFANSKYDAFFITSPFGIQSIISTNDGNFNPKFDINPTLFLLNFGYSYQKNNGSNGYIGLGFGSALEIQYGYGFKTHNNLIRVRSDVPLWLFSGYFKSLKYFSCGIFYEQGLKSEMKSKIFGLSISINTMNLILRD